MSYRQVRKDDYHEAHYDATTDVSDSPIERRIREKTWEELGHLAQPRQSSWRRCWSSMLIQGLLNTVLLVLVIALLLDRRWHQERYGQFEGAGDITGFVPPMSQQIKTFVPDLSFTPENGSDFFTDAVQDKWLSIVPSTSLVGPTS